MSAYHTHPEITARLKALSDKLSKGDLSENELNEFEVLSRRLYERAIVLNYKAKEAHVYSKSVSSKLVEEESKPSKVIEKEAKETVGTEEPKNAEQAPLENGEIAFDFSTEDSGDDTVDTVSQTKQEEVIRKEEPQESQEPVEKQSSEPIVQTEKEESVSEEKISSFFERFTKVHDDSLMSKLGASKLDTLKGAIGLNDKMQFISELFDGSSDMFNQAIEQLDEQQNNEKARFYLSKIAVKQNWDVEDPLVEEFVRILDRRYAE